MATLDDLPGFDTNKLLNFIWLFMMGVFLVYGLRLYRSGWLCAYMGTDFRGYYASAQIVWQRGFAEVYDPEVQKAFQAVLFPTCPQPTPLHSIYIVSVPYFPLFVLFFLPLALFDFTISYLFWIVLNLGALVIYLVHFSKSFGGRVSALKLIQWVICIPLIANLFLGQTNVWLVICVGEFILFFMKGKQVQSGFWLGGMLLKPQTLLLLLPGLVLSQNWGAVLGFILSTLFILGSSLLLAGIHGLEANALIIYRFTGPLIQTASSMMNFRSLALHLENHLPQWTAWALAISGAGLAVVYVLKQWLRPAGQADLRSGYILLATLAGTFAISWHSHFYLLMCLIPILIFLDSKKRLPDSVLSVWLFGPLILYGLIQMLRPDLTRSLFGLGTLALSQFLIAWAACRLSNDQRIQKPL